MCIGDFEGAAHRVRCVGTRFAKSPLIPLYLSNMKILSIRALRGPNVYHRRPVLVATIDLEQLWNTQSRDLPGFNERLLRAVPGLGTHRCSRGHEGGFVERLTEGTYFAHIVEHVALELSTAAGIDVGFGKARWAADRGVYNVIVRYKSEPGMKRIVEIAVELGLVARPAVAALKVPKVEVRDRPPAWV